MRVCLTGGAWASERILPVAGWLLAVCRLEGKILAAGKGRGGELVTKKTGAKEERHPVSSGCLSGFGAQERGAKP